MRETIRAVTLDLDDTLWPVDDVIARAEDRLHAWLEAHAPPVASAYPPARFAQYRRVVAGERPDIAHDYTALRHAAIVRVLDEHGCDPRLADPAMELFLAARQEVRLYAEAAEALARIAARFPVVALSNGNADIHRIGIQHHFVAAVSARSAGVAKPDPRIFHAACAAAGVEPASTLHVGDDPELDVHGALGAGLHAAWVNRRGLPWRGDPRAIELADLGALCAWLRV